MYLTGGSNHITLRGETKRNRCRGQGHSAREKVERANLLSPGRDDPRVAGGGVKREPPDISRMHLRARERLRHTILPVAARQGHGRFPASPFALRATEDRSSMRVRSGLYRSPHFSNDQSTPHSAALHTGLRSGHTSGVQDVNLFPSWMTLRLTARWRRARCGSRKPFFHNRREMESG
jgi:hypothetical protein